MHRYLPLSQRSTRTALYWRSIYFTTASWGPSKRKKNPGALGTCPGCPLVKTALPGPPADSYAYATGVSVCPGHVVTMYNSSSDNDVTPPPIWEWRIAISVSVCVFVRDRVFGTTRPIFTKLFVHVTCGRGSVLLWRRIDVLCTSTSGFMDDVILAHKPRLLDVAAQLKHSQPWAWL